MSGTITINCIPVIALFLQGAINLCDMGILVIELIIITHLAEQKSTAKSSQVS